jgi:uncharacterized membrane protein
MPDHSKRVRIIGSLGVLSALVCLISFIWYWYGPWAGLSFIACCGVGMLAGRLGSPSPTTKGKPSPDLLRIEYAGAQFHRVLNILTGHNLDHAICISARGRTFYFCSRCSGVFLGSLAGVCVLAFGWIGISPPFGLTVCLMLPLILDWTIQTMGFLESTNQRRFLTGILAGLGIALLHGVGALQLAIAILVYISIVYLGSIVLRKRRLY